MRILALDVGEGRIGLAVSDPGGILASPAGFLERTGQEEDVRRVLETALRLRAERIVVGIPLSMEGRHGPQARAAEAFRRALASATALPVVPWDERLTTVEAERRLQEAGARPSLERGRADAASAAIILQSYLDSLKARP